MSAGLTPGALEGQLAGHGGRTDGEVLPLAHGHVAGVLAGAEDPNRALAQVLDPVLGHEDGRRPAVGAHAAVELGEGVGDHPA